MKADDQHDHDQGRNKYVVFNSRLGSDLLIIHLPSVGGIKLSSDFAISKVC